ncbi:MAG: hypothetical protein AAB855_03670, partial [Patescibacteria group bacterium]
MYKMKLTSRTAIGLMMIFSLVGLNVPTLSAAGPTITIQPTSIAPGETFTATATGFTPGSDISITHNGSAVGVDLYFEEIKKQTDPTGSARFSGAVSEYDQGELSFD